MMEKTEKTLRKHLTPEQYNEVVDSSFDDMGRDLNMCGSCLWVTLCLKAIVLYRKGFSDEAFLDVLNTLVNRVEVNTRNRARAR